MFPAIREDLDGPGVTVLTGMRRTGKTSILNQLYSEIPDNKVFLDLENRANHEAFLLADYDLIWQRLLLNHGLSEKRKVFVFLDEIQNLAILPSVLKYLSDHKVVKFVVSGSSGFYLKNQFTESLAGRKKIFELFPLTFEEFLVFKGKRKNLTLVSKFDLLSIVKNDHENEILSPYFDEFLKFGGFPGVVLVDEEQKKIDLLRDILFSYVDQDVRKLADISKIEEFEKLIRLLPERIGQKIEVTRLSGEVGLSRNTVNEYLEFLEKTYFIFRVPPFTTSAGREISKAKKLFFCDTGLANVISQVSGGQLLENAMFNALNTKFQFDKTFGRIAYYQKEGGAEVDFILDGQIGVEIKNTASKFDVARTSRLGDKVGLKEVLVVSKNKSLAKDVIYASQV